MLDEKKETPMDAGHGPGTAPLVLGLDVGGSRTRGRLVRANRIVAEAEVRGANLSETGVEVLTRQLQELTALSRTGVAVVVAGIAGAETPSQKAAAGAVLRQLWPSAKIQVVLDAELILAAAGCAQGIALIAGTGSIAEGRAADGRTVRAGGWGYLLGDEGSAYWVAREAVRHALAQIDAGADLSGLDRRMLAEAEVDDGPGLLQRFHEPDSRSLWAARSRVVVDLAAAGDADARSIIENGARALGGLASTVAERLVIGGPVVLAGGLLQHEGLLQSLVSADLAARGMHEVQLLSEEPVAGAVRLARALAEPSS